MSISGVENDSMLWPVIDLGFVDAKVQLAAGVTLRFTRLVFLNWRKGPHFQAPGLDIIATSTPPGEDEPPSAWPHLVLENMASVQRGCLAPSLGKELGQSALRPAIAPGNQSITIILSQAGCSSSPDAPLLQRCWPMAALYEDLVFYASNLDKYAAVLPAGYVLWLEHAFIRCEAVLDETCVRTLGSLGCFYSLFPLSGNGTSLPLPKSQPPAPSPVPDAGLLAAPEGHDDGGQSLLGPILGGGLGGICFLAALTALAAWLVRRRRGSARAPAVMVAVGYKSSKMDLLQGEISAENDVRSTRVASRSEYAFSVVSDTAMVPVTPQTPLKEGVDLCLRPDGGDITLLPIIISKGTFGRVVEGMYGSQRVAVKLISRGLLATAGADPAAAAEATSHRPTLDSPATMSSTAVAELMWTDSPGPAAADPAATASLAPGTAQDSSMADSIGPQTGTMLWLRSVSGNPGAKLAAASEDGGGGGGGFQVPTALPELSDALHRTFVREVQVLARITHPNVVRLLAACLRPPQMCLVMELMETSLEQFLYGGGPNCGPMPLNKVLHIAIQMASALEYLHPTVMHRDLKPANVLLSDAASLAPVVKIADFGLSRLQTTVLITEDVEVGTAPYMAPETLSAYNCAVTHHVDVYALGIIMWEMLAGTRPWAGATLMQVACAVGVHQKRPPLEVLSADRCPARLRSLIEQCWDTVPQRRPAASEVVKELLLLVEKMMVNARDSATSRMALAASVRGGGGGAGRSGLGTTSEMEPGMPQ